MRIVALGVWTLLLLHIVVCMKGNAAKFRGVIFIFCDVMVTHVIMRMVHQFSVIVVYVSCERNVKMKSREYNFNTIGFLVEFYTG